MEIKTIIGSILAVALLLLVSFSNVVGYQSVKSDMKTNSPLFSIRNNKGDVTTDYIGKGEASLQLFNEHYYIKDYIHRIIDFLNDMDDESFDNFVTYYINYIHEKKDFNNIEVTDKQISDVIYKFRENSDLIEKNYVLSKDNNPLDFTINHPFCLLMMLFQIFIIYVFIIPFAVVLYILQGVFWFIATIIGTAGCLLIGFLDYPTILICVSAWFP